MERWPSQPQSLLAVGDLLLDVLATGPPATVVFALDGLTAAAGAAALAPSGSRPLISTFPTTSTTAWLTAATGRDAGDHLVPGFAYYEPAASRVLPCVVAASADGGSVATIPRLPTTFDRARALGFEPVALTGALDRWRGTWIDRVLAGARRIPPEPHDEANVELAAELAASQAHRAVADAIDQARPTLVWCYVDLDSHVHRHGYDGRVHRALGTIDSCASELARAGIPALAYADHGLVPSAPDARRVRAWRTLEESRLVRAGGGAGRVRWLHARNGVADLRARAAEIVGDTGVVLMRDELASLGLMRVTPGLAQRVGEVVALATEPEFPAFDATFAFDHGSVTPAERDVFLAVWGDRSQCEAMRAEAPAA